MNSKFLTCLDSSGFHKLHYLEWGDPNCPKVMICVHGLTRNAHDFDFLAQMIAHECRVICPDMPGCGQSEWLNNKENYAFPQYLNDLVALMARSGESTISWLGTSMGGLFGIFLAGLPKSPINRLLINDIGPTIPDPAVQRIREYVGTDPRFKDLSELELYLRAVHASFGKLTDRQWRHLAEHSYKQCPGGEYALHYDPAIAQAFSNEGIIKMQLWDFWDRITCPVAVFRGENSDVLLEETAKAMEVRGPKAKVFTFQGIGHAPSLMSSEQISLAQEWLREL